MATKHYFPETAVNSLVPRALTSFVAANPELALITDQRVVLNTTHKSSQVALISGGGSGHEPAWYFHPLTDPQNPLTQLTNTTGQAT